MASASVEITRILVVFDRPFNEHNYPFQKTGHSSYDLFPLTDDWLVIESVKKEFTTHSLNFELLNSAALIEKESSLLRERLISWSAALGERRLAGKSVKEWFLLKGEKVSTWWFSLLSEKNPLKTDAFLLLSQEHAIEQILVSHPYSACYYALENRILLEYVRSRCSSHSVEALSLRSKQDSGKNQKYSQRSIEEYQRIIEERYGVPGSMFVGIASWFKFILRSFRIKKIMGSIAARSHNPKTALFISYFPSYDREYAKKGIFKNHYALPIQDLMASTGKPINWLLIYEPFENIGFAEALSDAQRFAEHGEPVYFFEEFLSWPDAFRCLFLWIAVAVKSLFLSFKMSAGFLTEGLTSSEGTPLVKVLWNRSFSGPISMRGLLYYTVFKKVLRHFSGNSPCIYYLEMQAWEKALNAAGRHYPDAQMIGFQHSSFSKNHFSYFYAKDDLQQRGALTDLPLPGVLGCNGPIFERHFEEQGYPNVQQLEAVRNFYLRHVLNGSRPVKATPPVVLFAGTFSPQETKALFLMLRVACPKPDRFQVWIKTHPGTVGREQALGIDFNNSLYQIKQNPMSELLAEAKTVVAVSNSVALEALAFGCQVILPVFANALFMDPLANRQELFQKVYNPQQLIRAIDYTLQREVTDDELQQARNLVQSYWNIDESLPGWSRILLDRVARQPRPVGVGL